MSQEQTRYPATPPANATADELNVNPQPDAPIVAQETATLGEEAAQTAEAEQQAAQDIQRLEQEIVGELEAAVAAKEAALKTAVAAKDAEIADLKSKLAETEQRATLPPLAGNPAPSTAPAPLSGYDLIRKAVEGVQLGFDFK